MSQSTTKKPTLAEDDLDDLDDVLSEFDSSNVSSPPAPPPTAASSSFMGRPRTNTRVDGAPKSIPGSGTTLDPANEAEEDAITAEFAKELAKGMESLMKEITGDGKVEDDDDLTEAQKQEKIFKAAWEAMLVEGMNGSSADGGLEGLGGEPFQGPSDGDKGKTAAAGNFQDKLKHAMGKLKESESTLQGESGQSGAPNAESLEELLKSLGDLGLGEGGDEDNELAGLLENMMGQLLSKDVLYEPLKELAENFPSYLEKPPSPLSSEDRARYEKQLVCVKQILSMFDKEGYSDSDPVQNKQIVDLMSEMQSHGSPPPEIMGSLPPGLDGNLAGLSEEGCTIA